MNDSTENSIPDFKAPQELEGEITNSIPTQDSAEKGERVFTEEERKSFLLSLALQEEERSKLDEKQIEEIRSLRLKNDQLQAEIDKIKDDNKGRRNFSKNIFTSVVIWMFLVLMTVVCTGFGSLKLSDNVMIALLTTATANVIALLVIVANYLFNKDKST